MIIFSLVGMGVVTYLDEEGSPLSLAIFPLDRSAPPNCDAVGQKDVICQLIPHSSLAAESVMAIKQLRPPHIRSGI
jgi:hypothetical protein